MSQSLDDRIDGRRPRIAVFGSGAMGCLLAARLAAAKAADVAVAGTWPAALERMRAAGITLDAGGQVTTEPVIVLERDHLCAGEAGTFDLVIVVLKSYQTASAAAAAAHVASPEGLILTLQNGLGNRQQLADSAGTERVAVAASAAAATLISPGHVRAGGDGGTWLAPPAGKAVGDPCLAAVAGLLRHAGLKVALRSDAEPMLWGKVAVNCAINPLTAIAGLQNGALLASPERRALVAAVATEVAQVAVAAGVQLEEDVASRALAVAEATTENVSSMLQDLRAGRPTEIDALCGAVVREAARHEVAVPLNATLTDAVLRLERRAAGGAADPRALDRLVTEWAA